MNSKKTLAVVDTAPRSIFPLRLPDALVTGSSLGGYVAVPLAATVLLVPAWQAAFPAAYATFFMVTVRLKSLVLSWLVRAGFRHGSFSQILPAEVWQVAIAAAAFAVLALPPLALLDYARRRAAQRDEGPRTALIATTATLAPALQLLATPLLALGAATLTTGAAAVAWSVLSPLSPASFRVLSALVDDPAAYRLGSELFWVRNGLAEVFLLAFQLISLVPLTAWAATKMRRLVPSLPRPLQAASVLIPLVALLHVRLSVLWGEVGQLIRLVLRNGLTAPWLISLPAFLLGAVLLPHLAAAWFGSTPPSERVLALPKGTTEKALLEV